MNTNASFHAGAGDAEESNLHPIFQLALAPFAPARATGNHLAAQNDEPEPEGIQVPGWQEQRKRDEEHARELELQRLVQKGLLK
jgi:hypothetical protein